MAQPSAPSADLETIERARRFLADGLRFATIASVGADGGPFQAVAWYLIDADTLVLNSADGRAWPANLRRDPRVSVTVEDGYRWLSVRGTVEVVEDPARGLADIAAMARRYHADEPARAEAMIRDRFARQTRTSFRLPLASAKLHYEE